MKRRDRTCILIGCLLAIGVAGQRHVTTFAQGRPEPGRSIGTVSTQGDLIVMTLDEGVLGTANLFDLGGRTLRFTPGAGGYRGENLPLQWDADFGAEMSDDSLTLQRFAFPFSGQSWKQLSVGVTGSISFGPSRTPGPGAGTGGRGGVSIGRFDQLQNAAPALVNTVPAICVFMKPRMSGARFAKELPDRVVITWTLTEPAGGIQDFTWVPTVNRFQAVLRKDGAIELSYEQVAAKDAIVGLYPIVKEGKTTPVVSLSDPDDPVPAHVDLKGVTVTAVDGVFLNVSFETRGPVVPVGNPAADGVVYQLTLEPSAAAGARAAVARPIVWTVRGSVRGGRGGVGTRYTSSGPGVAADVTVSDRAISIKGVVPAGLGSRDPVRISAEASADESTGAAADQVPARSVTLSRVRSPRTDLSAMKPDDGPVPLVYEAFHYVALPNMRDMTCTVIKSLGDKFDFLAYYSDFRIDNQEAGTPSNGPLGGGPDGGEVTGIGAAQRGLESYCTQGRFQWQFIQPVYVGSNQMQKYPPAGTGDTANRRNIAAYAEQLGRRSADGKLLPYNYGISQIAHELGHRWSAFVSARVNGEVVPLGPTHWARGLHAPAAFPYQRPSEASAMGGGVWQDNFDGTFTQLDDDYYVPATGWSHLELYLMGLAAPSEVPDFFILRNLVPAGRDAHDRPIFKADRAKVTIADVIAVEGPRRPGVEHSQKQFNTGIVVIVEQGKAPSAELIERANGIRVRWMDYFATTTGHRASTTTNPR